MRTATPTIEHLLWCADCGNYTARPVHTICACGVWTRRVCTRHPDHRPQGSP